MIVKKDCRYFRGDVPCKPHKTSGVHCADCPQYSATDRLQLRVGYQYNPSPIGSEQAFFNVGSPLAFLTQKETEVYNLTVLSLGVDAAMKPDEIRNQLLI